MKDDYVTKQHLDERLGVLMDAVSDIIERQDARFDRFESTVETMRDMLVEIIPEIQANREERGLVNRDVARLNGWAEKVAPKVGVLFDL